MFLKYYPFFSRPKPTSPPRFVHLAPGTASGYFHLPSQMYRGGILLEVEILYIFSHELPFHRHHLHNRVDESADPFLSTGVHSLTASDQKIH